MDLVLMPGEGLATWDKIGEDFNSTEHGDT